MPGRGLSGIFIVIVLLSAWCVTGKQASAQGTLAEDTDSIRGMVVNSVTHEAIARALVFSPDNRFATMTDSQGRFEFTFPQGETDRGNDAVPAGAAPSVSSRREFNRPDMLIARKPGFLTDQGNESLNLPMSPATKEITISLVPEALIVGHVALPTSEAPDRIQVEIYRRQVQDGRAHWHSAGVATTKSTGEFRFPELSAGTYRLFTHELQDRDPQIAVPGGQLYGYAPVYFPNATSFASGSAIQLLSGQTYQADLSLVRQPYYPVKVAVANVPPATGLAITVFPDGRKGPGYALGYAAHEQSIEGSLPNGIYTLEASGYGQNPFNGSLNITVHGAPLVGPVMTLAPGRALSLNVKEEFTTTESTGATSWSDGARTFKLRGPRTYLNVTLVSADEFDQQRGASLRPPSGPDDESLVIDNVQPGRYWVQINSSRGFARSITSGGIDLLHEPLVVGSGGASPPIEVTMADDGGKIEGKVEGADASLSGTERPSTLGSGMASPVFYTPFAYIYCFPLPDGSGQFTEAVAYSDGKFTSPPMPPGVYLVLAFKRKQSELEYRNPEAMRAYGAKGQTVRVAAGKTEHLQLGLISSSE
ncbi:MAG: hypothetical protein WA655_09245 [Candidatus Korobacteraceae bacterium]